MNPCGAGSDCLSRTVVGTGIGPEKEENPYCHDAPVDGRTGVRQLQGPRRRTEEGKTNFKAIAMRAALLNEAGHVLMADGRCPDGVWAGATKALKDNGAAG